MHCLYLHGFASSPATAKGQALGMRLRGAVDTYAIPDLEAGDFSGLTMDLIGARTRAAIDALPEDGAGVLLIGSSLGGYAAALLAARRVSARLAGVLLIAPAFGFTDSWRERLGDAGLAAWRDQGSLPFFHHAVGRELPLGYAFYRSCLDLPAFPGPPGVPVAIVHGRGDETVDWRRSLEYATRHPAVELHLVAGDHRLTEPRHEDLIEWCARDLLSRGGASLA